MEPTQISRAPKPSRTGLFAVVGVIAVLILGGASFGGYRYVAGQQATATYVYGHGPCGVVVVDEAVQAMRRSAIAISDLNDVASATGRGALSPLVQDMQTVRQDAEDVAVPECLELAQLNLVLSIDDVIEGYLAFMSQERDAVIADHFESAAQHLGNYNDEVARVTDCAPECD